MPYGLDDHGRPFFLISLWTDDLWVKDMKDLCTLWISRRWRHYAARSDWNHHERLWGRHDGIEAHSQQQGSTDGSSAGAERGKMKKAAEAAMCAFLPLRGKVALLVTL
jgi:hypothetical protein